PSVPETPPGWCKARTHPAAAESPGRSAPPPRPASPVAPSAPPACAAHRHDSDPPQESADKSPPPHPGATPGGAQPPVQKAPEASSGKSRFTSKARRHEGNARRKTKRRKAQNYDVLRLHVLGFAFPSCLRAFVVNVFSTATQTASR